MVLENIYLKKALSKVGCVVIVKTCQKTDRKSRLEYISPNADTIGMNVELINKGMKLTEDYIHPADREKVIKTVVEAAASNVDSYVHHHRMVGDDGILYNVQNEICITERTSDAFKIEMYITLAAEKKTDFSDKAEDESYDSDKTEYKIPADNNIIESSTGLFSKLVKLYSTFVDMSGRVVIPPTGPETNLGDFYDLFEKPAYKEYYKHIKHTTLSQKVPVIIDREEGGAGKICAAPVKLKDEVIGLWILGSYTKAETDKLNSVCDSQWLLAGMISDYIEKTAGSSNEAAKARGAGIKLREELARQNVINEALSKVDSNLVETVDQVVAETMRDVGINMDIDKVILYMAGIDSKGKYVLSNYWDAGGKTPGEELTVTLPRKKYVFSPEFEKGNYVAIDNSNMTEEYKLTLMHYGFKAIIAQPVYMNDELQGMLLFAECKSERVWSKEELRFSKSITLVIQNMLNNAYGDGNIRNVNKHLIDIYNTFKVGIFVRDAHTGEVLFSNKAMDDMLGYDFKGKDSRELITDLHDRFNNISGMRRPFITKNKETSWRCYIQKLDAIMDITEIKMEWLNGQPASFIVLRKANDGTKEG